MLGAGVGGLIVITNTRTLMRAFDVPPAVTAPVYGTLWLVWIAAVVVALRMARPEPAVALLDLEVDTEATA